MNDYKNEIQVSVCVVTYNQEEYIAECLESLVHQVTNFKFEIIVGEDCSTDNTRSIVQQYVEKYPNLIVPLFHQNNVGAAENVLQVYKKAKGKYIAHIDGDDMALPNKLQKQFDTMEKNPQAIICSHNVSEIKENVVLKNCYWNHPEGEYSYLDLIKKLPFFAHSSKFFRVLDEIDLSKILNEREVLDIELHLYQTLNGTIIHLNEHYGIYRSGVGISAAKDSKINYDMIKRVKNIYENLLTTNPETSEEIRKAYASYLLGTAASFAVIESNDIKMKQYILESFNQGFFTKKQIIMYFLAISPKTGVKILKFKHKLIKYKSN